MFKKIFRSLFNTEIKKEAEEIKILADFSYDKTEKDREDIQKIQGLDFIREIFHRPIEKPYYQYKIDGLTTIDEILLFLKTVPEDFQFSFFDNFYPQLSDPGAYVTVQHYEMNFIHQLGNHDWSDKWKVISTEILVNYIYKNREFQRDNIIEVYRRYKAVSEGQWP